MSVQSEIRRIDNNIKSSLEEVAAEGVIVPDDANSDNLSNLIRAIPRGFTEEDLDAKYNEGLADGEQKVKDTEARTSDDIILSSDIASITASVTIPSGYYAEDVTKTRDLETEFYDPAFDEGWSEGYNDGLADGEQKVKDEEGRDAGYIVTDLYVDDKQVEVSVTPGYYAEEAITYVDVTDVYIRGLEDGGGADVEEVNQMLRVSDEEYSDEGVFFYSPFKHLKIARTGFSSRPVITSIMNTHPSLFIHIYMKITVENQVDSDEYGAPIFQYDEHTYTFVVDPGDYDLSIEFDEEDGRVIDTNIEGIRWSTDGV